jgi:hypothetical protein
MKAVVLFIALAMLVACSPEGQSDNPRDRAGQDGALSWRVVSGEEGQAAFLSKPGAAPDIVLWCRNNGLMTLRAHIFEAPSPQPDLSLATSGGKLVFSSVRRQGGVRAGDRKLVEGSVALSSPNLSAVLLAAANVTITSDRASFQALNADPNAVLPDFVAGCVAATRN